MHATGVPAAHEPDPLHDPCGVNVLPLQVAAAPHDVPVGYTQAPVPAAQSVAPQVPVPHAAAQQWVPLPLVPHADDWHCEFSLHAAPAASFETHTPVGPGFEQ